MFRSMLFLMLIAPLLFGDPAPKKIKGKPIKGQSFKATLSDHFKEVTFAAHSDGFKLHLYLLKGKKIVHQFQNHPGNDWLFDQLLAISFKDLNGDNLKDVIVLSNHITGMGSGGMIPFSVVGVYINHKTTFKPSDKLNKLLNGGKNADSLKTIKAVVKAIKKIQKRE